LDTGDVVYRTSDINRLRDAMYVVEAALADARMDIADGGLDDYPQAFSGLAGAVDSLFRTPLEPKAVG
jgi:hypothetical protein